ncbi:hypothetical protein BD324DRAFT_680981 [Kockovaella imperatae]|uniref:Uncharacterized protein n=1 Tax=Kockovaella imperatae TaxID=4999 RepID=A0A1Y1UHT1_9TREE|nr:hypothetical protein BD324DRAFT_680981 [Kockovaella imperatae]ORX37046.1 hypothetical protein BD324DRAFT_680981 [Kockovaella imperatae]
MTHLTPTSLLFFSMAIVISYVYFWWHLWYYDRFVSIFPTRRQAFKCIMTWLYLATHMLYGTFAMVLTCIKYSVGYMTIPNVGTIPTPYLRWPHHFQVLVAPLYFVLAAALVLHVSKRRATGSTSLNPSVAGLSNRGFLQKWFMVWFIGSIGGAMSIFAAAVPFRDDPQQMETNILFAAAIWTVVATIASVYVVVKFPELIRQVIFCIPFLAISIDGLTSQHEIGHREYLTDLLLMVGFFGLFARSILSILILFPPMKRFGSSERSTTITLIHSSPVKLGPSHFTKSLVEIEDARQKENEQIKSQLSIVAPFATPPATPIPYDAKSWEADQKDQMEDYIRAKRPVQQAQVREHQSATQEAFSRLGSPLQALRNPFQGNESRRELPSAGSHREGFGEDAAGKQYAWSMLADHLRLPETAMGLMSIEMTETNKKWREAQRKVEQQFFPGTMTQTQREMTIRFKDHSERFRSPRPSVDPSENERPGPRRASSPGTTPEPGPPVPILQLDDSVLYPSYAADGLPTGQSGQFAHRWSGASARASNTGTSTNGTTTTPRGRQHSLKRKALPKLPSTSL